MKVLGVDCTPYALKARLRPALFVALPIGFGVAAWFPTEIQAWGWLVGVAGACGVTFFFAETVADVGRCKQRILWKEWDGAPTTVCLRHRSASCNPHTLARYHEKLHALRPDLRIPTPEQEAADPAGADLVYESCVDFLREATRDVSSYPMVFSDNVNYGSRRNLWGIKPWGIATSLVGAMVAGSKVLQQWMAVHTVSKPAVAALALCTLFLAFFICVVNERWVRQAGDAYARRLLEGLERLQGERVGSSME